MSPREIANQLGHSDPSMTMNAYMDRRSASERAADLL